MLATLVDAPFDDKTWVFETKWDGFRLITEKRGQHPGGVNDEGLLPWPNPGGEINRCGLFREEIIPYYFDHLAGNGMTT